MELQDYTEGSNFYNISYMVHEIDLRIRTGQLARALLKNQPTIKKGNAIVGFDEAFSDAYKSYKPMSENSNYVDDFPELVRFHSRQNEMDAFSANYAGSKFESMLAARNKFSFTKYMDTLGSVRAIQTILDKGKMDSADRKMISNEIDTLSKYAVKTDDPDKDLLTPLKYLSEKNDFFITKLPNKILRHFSRDLDDDYRKTLKIRDGMLEDMKRQAYFAELAIRNRNSPKITMEEFYEKLKRNSDDNLEHMLFM